MSDTLAQAYAHSLQLAASHYENFPVASRLLPQRLRRPIAVIYAFARQADDFADEGDAPAHERLAKLAAYGEKLHALERGEKVDDPLFIAVGDVIVRHRLPYVLFHDLLSAFAQDVTRKRYADYAQVLDYCRRSADPIGRLLLHLYGAASPLNLQRSDAVCSALQLINFWQDLAQDYDENDRIYLPQDDMARFGVSEEHLRERRTDAAMRALMDFEIERARALLLGGAPLASDLGGRLGMELRLTVGGGLAIADALLRNRQDCFARPRLRRRDWARLLWRSAVRRRIG